MTKEDMTREEAIEHLNTIGIYYSQDHSDPYGECARLTKDELDAICLAIKALEQEPCSNAIDRDEAIRIASGYCHPANVPKELAKLPPVKVEPKIEMIEQWQELKETIIEMRDNDGTATQQEACKFLANLMDILEKQMQEPKMQEVVE